MSRSTTPKLGLGVWDQNDKPGAGSKTVKTGNTGLNGDWLILDDALGTQHNTDGTHKNDMIDGPNLKTTSADGSSIELAGSPLKLGVKLLGIQKGHINSNVVDGVSLQKNPTSGALELLSVVAGKILGTGTGKAVDGSTIGLNGSNELEVKDAGITAAKLSHNNVRTKIWIPFSFADGFSTSTYGYLGGHQMAGGKGLSPLRAGAITGIAIRASGGASFQATTGYVSSGTTHFAITDVLTVVDGGLMSPTNSIYVRISGTNALGVTYDSDSYGLAKFGMIEIELDS